MCFSATASFVASGAIGGVAVAGSRNVRSRRSLPLVLIPFILALQQATEGIVWISLSYPFINGIAAKIYLFIAYAFWPAFLPLAVYLEEKMDERKTYLLPFVVGGSLVGLYGLIYAVFAFTSVVPSCGSLFYQFPALSMVFSVMYVFVCCTSCLLSGSRWLNLFGLALFGSFIFAYAISYQTGDSVWCFFAGLLSWMIYMHFRSEGKTPRAA